MDGSYYLPRGWLHLLHETMDILRTTALTTPAFAALRTIPRCAFPAPYALWTRTHTAHRGRYRTPPTRTTTHHVEPTRRYLPYRTPTRVTYYRSRTPTLHR